MPLKTNTYILSTACALAFTLAFAPGAFAQANYPSRPIRVVVPYTPGGITDVVTRIVAQEVSKGVGQTLLIDNRPGANSILGVDILSKATADGYTVGAVIAAHAANQTLYPKLPYHSVKSFEAVSLLATAPLIVCATNSLAAKDAKELVALAKAKPKQIVYGSTGNGGMPHLAVESLRVAAGIELVHVPYKGAAPVVIDLLGGHVLLTILDVPVLLPHVKSGKMRALAVATAKRQATLPNVPTMTEAGYPSVRADNWYGYVIAAATPRDIAAKLHAALVKSLDAPDTRERLMSQGAEARSSTPEQFAAFIRDETATWGKIIKAAGVALE